MTHIPIVTITKCKGESPDGKFICKGREVCYRYKKPTIEHQDFVDFWRAGDACPNSLSIPKGE